MGKLSAVVDGVKCVVYLVPTGAVWIRLVRVKKDGQEEEAFLSSRQGRKEAAIRRIFAKEIAAHIEAHRAATVAA